MLGMDEPEHGRHRALVSKAFSQKALRVSHIARHEIVELAEVLEIIEKLHRNTP
jgi:cytochrome P450